MFQQNLQNETAPVEQTQNPDINSNVEVDEAAKAVERTNEAPKEISIVHEQPAASGQQAIQSDDNQTVSDIPPADEDEIKEELSGRVDAGNGVWAKKAKSVIKEYQNEPYEEEETAEDLQLEYLNQRFGVKIDKKEHEAK